MFWQCLGWPESKPAVKKFWTIQTKSNGLSFHGKRAVSKWIAVSLIWQRYQQKSFSLFQDLYMYIYMDIQAVISNFLSGSVSIWEWFFVKCEVLKDWQVMIYHLFTVPYISTLCLNNCLEKITLSLGLESFNTISQGTEQRQSDSQLNSLYRAARFANFEGILGFSVQLIFLAALAPRKHIFIWTSSKGYDLWLVHFDAFCLFLCFIKFVACDLPV